MASRSSRIDNLRKAIEAIESDGSFGVEQRAGEGDNVLPEAPRPSAGQDSEAFARIVRLCSVRDRSSKELRDRLLDEDFEDFDVDGALERARNCNLVNDLRFADARIRKLVHDNKGKNGIARDLETFGIDIDRVPGWPEEYLHGATEVSRAMCFLEHRPSRSKNLLRGSYQKLVAAGYTSDVAAKAAKRWTMGS